MKHTFSSTVLCALTGAAAIGSLASCKAQKESAPKKPMNIVYIMCDDHSYQTISAYDQRYMQTPNIDRIANEGARFTNSFVANSLSGPSRACMLTGKLGYLTNRGSVPTGHRSGQSYAAGWAADSRDGH